MDNKSVPTGPGSPQGHSCGYSWATLLQTHHYEKLGGLRRPDGCTPLVNDDVPGTMKQSHIPIPSLSAQ